MTDYSINKDDVLFLQDVFREKTQQIVDVLVKHKYENSELETFRLAQIESSKQILDLKSQLSTAKAELDREREKMEKYRKVIEGAMNIKDLWLPMYCDEAHIGEIRALYVMHSSFVELLNEKGE